MKQHFTNSRNVVKRAMVVDLLRHGSPPLSKENKVLDW